MECDKKTPAELVADLMLDPGFVLVPQDRYEELIRAETERDVIEATLSGDIKYSIDAVMKAILTARRGYPPSNYSGGDFTELGDDDDGELPF